MSSEMFQVDYETCLAPGLHFLKSNWQPVIIYSLTSQGREAERAARLALTHLMPALLSTFELDEQFPFSLSLVVFRPLAFRVPNHPLNIVTLVTSASNSPSSHHQPFLPSGKPLNKNVASFHRSVALFLIQPRQLVFFMSCRHLEESIACQTNAKSHACVSSCMLCLSLVWVRMLKSSRASPRCSVPPCAHAPLASHISGVEFPNQFIQIICKIKSS